MSKKIAQLLILTLILLPGVGFSADPGLQILTVETTGNHQKYAITVQVLLLMTVLTFLPAVFVMMTSFTRIIIVLAILRQALGLVSTPSSQILIGLSLFLTFFIMSPVFEQAYTQGVKPYMDEKLDAQTALKIATDPFKQFMLAQTRENDLAVFSEISGRGQINSADETPFSLLLPAFVTSELKTAFQIGFLIFIPFLIIDLVVASVLMAMGMMMLSPMMISLPFKIMLFVLVDGWTLIMGTLANSFYT